MHEEAPNIFSRMRLKTVKGQEGLDKEMRTFTMHTGTTDFGTIVDG